MRLPAVSSEVVRLLPAVFVKARRAGSGQIATAGRRLSLPWGRKAGRLPARRHLRDLRPPARRDEKIGAEAMGPDTSITAAERQKIEQQKEREAQLARQEEAQIDAFVLGVLGEKRGAAVLRREKLKPKNEGLQGKTPEAGCVVM